MVQNVSQDDIDVKKTTDDINQEPKSATKTDHGLKLDYNDNNDHRSLSRSKSK